jgi:multiple sugar transport system substrate-binding protein
MRGDRVNRRSFLRGGAATVAGLSVGGPLLAACGGDDESAAGKAITIGTYADPGVDPVKTLLGRFREETGIRARFLTTEYNTWFEKSLQDARTGAGAYDVMIIDEPWIPQFASGELIEPMDEIGVEPDDDMITNVLDPGFWPPRKGAVPPQFEGQEPRYVSAPLIGDCQTLAYRTDVFGSTPETWDDIVANAQEYTKRDARRYGWCFPGDRGSSPGAGNWIVYNYTFGGDWFDEAWEPILNNEQAVASLEFQLSLMRYCPENVASFSYDQQLAAFQRGEVAAVNLFGGFLKESFNPETSKVADRVGTAAPPKEERHATILGSFMAVVPGGAKNPEGAAEFINWFTSKEIQVEYARLGGFPVRTSAFADEQALSEAPYLAGVADALASGFGRPKDTEQAEIDAALDLQCNRAYVEAGKAGASSYLDEAAAQARQILDRAGYYA